jgi:hypothetical protein
VEQDVLRLDVAVHHVVAVGVVQRGGDLAGDGEGVGQRELPLALEPLAQRAAFHVGHDVEEQLARLARVVHRQDMRVVEAGGQLDLAEEALGADRGGKVGAEDLERDLTVVAEVLGQEDDGHPALAELALDPVAAGQGAIELILQGGHHRPPKALGGTVCRYSHNARISSSVRFFVYSKGMNESIGAPPGRFPSRRARKKSASV